MTRIKWRILENGESNDKITSFLLLNNGNENEMFEFNGGSTYIDGKLMLVTSLLFTSVLILIIIKLQKGFCYNDFTMRHHNNRVLLVVHLFESYLKLLMSCWHEIFLRTQHWFASKPISVLEMSSQ